MKFLLSALLIVLLAACGFTPMYGSGANGGVKGNLDRVEIEIIPDQSGVYLRNALIDQFYQSGYPSSPTHSLRVSKIRETVTDLDITIDSEATRKQIKLVADITLVENATQRVVMSRSLRSVTSYNVLGSQFTTRVSQGDAREAGLNDLARQIESHIALYFKRGGE